MTFQVEFYETKNGKIPMEEFLQTLDPKMHAKMVSMLELLEEKGNQLREPFSVPLGNGLFELRCQQSNNITRALYFFHSGGKIVVTNGFIKKTQKTPKAEIELANKYRSDYLERMVPS